MLSTRFQLLESFPARFSLVLTYTPSDLRKVFWGRHVWARGYFCCSSGNVTDEVIAAYIEDQKHEEDAEFGVEGEERL